MTITSVSMGNVLTYSTFSGQLHGVKVLDYTYTIVDGVETKLFITQSGKIADNEWVPSKGTEYIAVQTEDALRASYTDKWTKSRFKKGDFLISSGPTPRVFFFESDDKVWRMDNGSWEKGSTHATLKSRENEYGTLKVFTTANGHPFRKVVSGEHMS